MTTPSYSCLAEAAADIGFDLQSLPLRRMWLTGEGCSFAFRERVEKIWGAKANFYYGSLEGGGLGVECDEHRVTTSPCPMPWWKSSTQRPIRYWSLGKSVKLSLRACCAGIHR